MVSTKPQIQEETQKEKISKPSHNKVWKQIPIRDGSNFMSNMSSAQRYFVDADQSEISFVNINRTCISAEDFVGVIKKRIKRRLQSRINNDPPTQLIKLNPTTRVASPDIEKAEK